MLLLNLKNIRSSITSSDIMRMFVHTQVDNLGLSVPLAALIPLVDEQVFLSKQSTHIQSIRLLHSLLLLGLLKESRGETIRINRFSTQWNNKQLSKKNRFSFQQLLCWKPHLDKLRRSSSFNGQLGRRTEKTVLIKKSALQGNWDATKTAITWICKIHIITALYLNIISFCKCILLSTHKYTRPRGEKN